MTTSDMMLAAQGFMVTMPSFPMMIRILLPLFIPIATWWVGRQQRYILTHGAGLSGSLLEDARRAGVREPEKVRLMCVEAMPWPLPVALHGLATRMGIFSPHTVGLTLGHGIYLKNGHQGSRSLIVHELAHTAQYERLGGVRPFLKQYLAECVSGSGYPYGPLEQEAVRVAGDVCGGGTECT